MPSCSTAAWALRAKRYWCLGDEHSSALLCFSALRLASPRSPAASSLWTEDVVGHHGSQDQRYWAARLHDLGCGSAGISVDELLSHNAAAVVGLVHQALQPPDNMSSAGGLSRTRMQANASECKRMRRNLLVCKSSTGTRAATGGVFEALEMDARDTVALMWWLSSPIRTESLL